jgi:hypothetical protein
MRLDETVLDHHQGRCTSVNVVKGRAVNVQSGPEWFAGLDAEQQRQIAGAANWEAMQAGKVHLQDCVGTYTDAVFGEMVRVNSLVGVLGPDAKDYYR